MAFAFVLLLLLHFSAAVSRLTDQSKVLAQRLALLEQRLEEAEEREDGATIRATPRATATAQRLDDDVIEPVGAPRAHRR